MIQSAPMRGSGAGLRMCSRAIELTRVIHENLNKVVGLNLEEMAMGVGVMVAVRTVPLVCTAHICGGRFRWLHTTHTSYATSNVAERIAKP